MKHDQLARELIELANHDLTVREQLVRENKLSDGYNPDMEAVHRANAARLRDIIALIGWPSRSKVGDEASDAAWLIVQHAIGEASFMKEAYELMLAVREDVNPKNLAYLYDRICFFSGKPQRYGTQYTGQHQLHPVENKELVNELRAELGLPLLPLAHLMQAAEAGELPPDDDSRAWLQKAGWISS